MRRRAPRPQSLTSMIDVLFILLFASLATAAASANSPPPVEPTPPAELTPPQPDASPVAPSDYASAREVGIETAAARLAGKPAVVLRVSEAGSLRAIETGVGSVLELDVPLVEEVADRDVALAYIGDRSPELQLCPIAARLVPIDGRLIVIAPERPLADLPVALVAGMRRDIDRCAAAWAVIAEPEGTR